MDFNNFYMSGNRNKYSDTEEETILISNLWESKGYGAQ